jgi:hypothetical protein
MLDNLKMDSNDSVMEFAAKMNSNLSQLCERIPRRQILNIPAELTSQELQFWKSFKQEDIFEWHLDAQSILQSALSMSESDHPL